MGTTGLWLAPYILSGSGCWELMGETVGLAIWILMTEFNGLFTSIGIDSLAKQLSNLPLSPLASNHMWFDELCVLWSYIFSSTIALSC